jgi:hypothetical protein
MSRLKEEKPCHMQSRAYGVYKFTNEIGITPPGSYSDRVILGLVFDYLLSTIAARISYADSVW